jgi:glycosyltransferase involved in cell wall biosynthesis
MNPRTTPPEQESLSPLVSVGLPTFDRASTLVRAIESVLVQDWPNLELVVSDNGSSDGTEEVCKKFCQQDPRVRYVRHHKNLGPTANFAAVLEHSRGEYFMWLGDDDWLADPGYVSTCTSFLIGNPDYALACGVAHYYRGETFVTDGVQLNLEHPSPIRRVLDFYAAVGDNGTFYGVMRTSLLRLFVLKPTLGGDWLLVAAVAFSGRVRTLKGTAINREYTWDSDSYARIVRQESLPTAHSRFPMLRIGLSVLLEIAWKSRTYRRIPFAKRVFVGLGCSWHVVRRYGLPTLRDTARAALRRALPHWVRNILRALINRMRRRTARKQCTPRGPAGDP